MRLLFWLSLGVIGYAYFGYAMALAAYARLRRKPLRSGAHLPTVSIIIAAHNEERRLPAKLANLSALQYPGDLLEIVIASDGSSDGTAALLAEFAAQTSNRVHPVILDRAMGKASALNEAVRQAHGNILVFLDVRQSVDLDAVSELVSCFADPEIGAVSGELLLEEAVDSAGGSALGIYWRIEKLIRRLESQSGSVIGATGAIYAVRRDCYVDLPQGTILDDVFVPMNVVRMGKRVVFQPRAIARDRIFGEKGKEFGRKVRTLTGNYQLLQLAPWLLSPTNPVLFRFVSHKLLRLVVPLLLVFLLVTSMAAEGAFYKASLVLQLVFYALAVCGQMRPSTQGSKPIAIAHTFVMLNVATTLAFYNFVTNRKNIWV